MASFLQRLTKPSVTNEPPNPAEVWRNDLLMIGTLIFALFLGYGVRGQALDSSQTVAMGDNLPTISAPVRWLTQQVDTGRFQVRNPASASSFDAEIDVITLPISDSVGLIESTGTDPFTDQQTLDAARLNWSLRRAKELQNYRELESKGVMVRPTIGRSRGTERPGTLTTYAYVADPSLESGANGLPVVVQAQDLLFLHDHSLIVVTVAADATEWEGEMRNFDKALNSLRIKDQVTDATQPNQSAPKAEAEAVPAETTPAEATPAEKSSQEGSK